MLIHHRGIYTDRFDAPFGIGAMIWAKDCHHQCTGCFHQDRFGEPVYEDEVTELVRKVKSNPFNNGIVLGGFEWTEQYEELLALIEEARDAELEVILYTHYTIEEISNYFSELLKYKGIYIKCGEYDNTKLSVTHTSYGVPLASTNQNIYKIGDDI